MACHGISLVAPRNVCNVRLASTFNIHGRPPAWSVGLVQPRASAPSPSLRVQNADAGRSHRSMAHQGACPARLMRLTQEQDDAITWVRIAGPYITTARVRVGTMSAHGQAAVLTRRRAQRWAGLPSNWAAARPNVPFAKPENIREALIQSVRRARAAWSGSTRLLGRCRALTAKPVPSHLCLGLTCAKAVRRTATRTIKLHTTELGGVGVAAMRGTTSRRPRRVFAQTGRAFSAQHSIKAAGPSSAPPARPASIRTSVTTQCVKTARAVLRRPLARHAGRTAPECSIRRKSLLRHYALHAYVDERRV